MKAPGPGGVKSRLAADVGELVAAEIYRNFVLDAVSMLKASGYQFRICFYPKDQKDAVAGWLGCGHRYMAQEGNDLGERMANAFREVFSEGFRQAVLIGSDIPDLAPAVITAAFSALRDHDVVLGPAGDGGYYLIGFSPRSFLPQLFRGIRWSTNTVLGETLKLLSTAKQEVGLLPQWSDVDSLEDLKALYSRNLETLFNGSHTMMYLRSKAKGIVNADDQTE